jgi:GNAT superfamily N-acetyltransferase
LKFLLLALIPFSTIDRFRSLVSDCYWVILRVQGFFWAKARFWAVSGTCQGPGLRSANIPSRPGAASRVLDPTFYGRYTTNVIVLLRIRMTVREIRPSDVPRLQKLWVEFMNFHSNFDPDFKRSENAEANWAKYIHSKFDKDSETVFVAIEDGDIVGYVGVVVREYPPIFTIKKFGFIEEIAVTSKFRRHGIASQLLLAAEDWLRVRGITQIRVNIDLANKSSQGFFRSHEYLDDTETLLKKV